jgi:DNA-binding NtrC family response regulator
MEHTVLLVDDDQNVLHGLARALRLQPYQLYMAGSGEEAMLILKSREVDVIVADEQMPGMSGSDLLAWVADNCPDVMRIVLTGHPTVETTIRAINEGGVHQFFTKPCNPALLGVAIRKAMEHKDLLVENRRLANLNRRQMKQLEQYSRDLRILTSIVSQDIQEPLRTISRSCRLIQEQYDDILDPKAREVVENALDGVAEVQRLVKHLLEHCRTQEPESSADQSYSDQVTAASVIDDG